MDSNLVARQEEQNRDLGFGSVVSRESRVRLLNRDGSFNVRRKGLSFWTSLSFYHAMLGASWEIFFLVVVALYVAVNALFACLYLLSGPSALAGSGGPFVEHGFARAFFFSVQTMSTIGYGQVIPNGFAANVIVTMEALSGLLGFAIVTGMLFARFSKPTAKIVFSRYALIAPYQGLRAFEFRISNARNNQIIELQALVMLSRFEDVAGVRTRRYYTLPLERPRVAFFPLSWTIVHPIDGDSPLFGETEDSLRQSGSEFLVLLTGIDETFSETVHARSSYAAEEVVWNAKFGNIFDPPENDRVTIDLRRLDSIERVAS